LRDDTPMTLEPGEFERLRSMHDRLDMKEVEEIFLPLSRLLSIYVDATMRLYQAQRQFLGIRDRQGALHHRRRRVGGGGQIDHRARAAGAVSALVAAAQGRSRDHRRLFVSNGRARAPGPDAEEGAFPRATHLPMLLAFLSDIKAGRRSVRAPVYSHLTYDIIPNQWIEIDRPDILIVEGGQRAANRPAAARRQGGACGLRFFDFSVYLDADEPVLRDWFVRRFLALRDTAFTDPRFLLPSLRAAVG